MQVELAIWDMANRCASDIQKLTEHMAMFLYIGKRHQIDGRMGTMLDTVMELILYRILLLQAHLSRGREA